MKKITLFLSTMMLLTLACTSTNAIVSHNNVEDITSKIEGLEGVRLNKEAKYESTIDFNNNGAGSAYLSNVKVQYAPGTNENTASLRLVSAVKANITSATEVELPGTYGFHISYVKDTGLVDFMYDVEYFYHSMGATTASGTTYYTNEYSSYLNNENRKDISALGIYPDWCVCVGARRYLRCIFSLFDFRCRRNLKAGYSLQQEHGRSRYCYKKQAFHKLCEPCGFDS